MTPWAPRRPGERSPAAPSAAPPRGQLPRGELPTSLFELDYLKACAERYVSAARADNTRRAYASDWTAFERWGLGHGQAPLPATPDVLALYLTHLAQLGRRPSTIRRARIAIGLEHALRGAERPDQHVGTRQLERGIGRTRGSREEGPPPLLDQELALAAHALGDGTLDARDRAIVLLGFAGAFRAGELVGLNIPDVTFTAGGLDVFIRRSKEDQLGRGHTTSIEFGSSPMQALQLARAHGRRHRRPHAPRGTRRRHFYLGQRRHY